MEKEITINDIMAHYTEEDMVILAQRQAENPFFIAQADNISKSSYEEILTKIIVIENSEKLNKETKAAFKLLLLQGAKSRAKKEKPDNEETLKRTLALSSTRYYN